MKLGENLYAHLVSRETLLRNHRLKKSHLHQGLQLLSGIYFWVSCNVIKNAWLKLRVCETFCRKIMFDTNRRSGISTSELGLYSDRSERNCHRSGYGTVVVKQFVVVVMIIITVVLVSFFKKKERLFLSATKKNLNVTIIFFLFFFL